MKLLKLIPACQPMSSNYAGLLRSFLCNRRSGTFIAPERPSIDSTDTKSTIVKGREDPNLFSSEYIPPPIRPEWHRNKLSYRLERMDCLRRRKATNIPEFYPGSILAVTVADQYAPGKSMRFSGRCLYRDGFGLGCKFLLRNVINGEGVEVIYQLFSPLIQKYEVLRLEKWIDTDLRYLRDAADQSICTIDSKMSPEAPLPTTEELPIFKDKIKLREQPRWSYNYHKTWPRPYNAFIEEHFIEEELVAFQRVNRHRSDLQYDICRHYDITKMKEKIIEEMKDNALRIAVADESIATQTIS